MLKIGHGFDIHPLKARRKLILGGVEFVHEKGLDGHSDADVILHAVMDAVLGALGMGDIGKHFPNTDPEYKNISSRKLLKIVCSMLAESEYCVGNIDITVHAEKPKIASRIVEMIENIADDLDCSIDQINIKATTWEGLGYIGREEGIAADAVVLLITRDYEKESKDEEDVGKLKKSKKKKTQMAPSSLFDDADDEPVVKKVKTKGLVVIYTDGASRGNPGPAGAGAIIEDGNGKLLMEISLFLGTLTNNQAEYQALILALNEVDGLRPEKLLIRSDSELMVRQLSGEYKVKDAKLLSLFNIVKQQLKLLKSWDVEHIPREKNSKADSLANMAIDSAI